MNILLNMEGAKPHSFPFHIPEFQLAGNITAGQRNALRAIEELFFIRFIEEDVIDLNRKENITGKIIFIPNDNDDIENPKYALNIHSPNLILNVTDSNVYFMKNILKYEVQGAVLECRDYIISPNEKDFGPLRGFKISEKGFRNIFTLSSNSSIENLVTSRDSCIFGKTGNVYFSTVGLSEVYENHGLRDEFSDICFMGLLPLFLFLRRCLGDQQFKPANIRACCIVDDANLRLSRYGHMKYADIVKSAKSHNYHLAIGMVPIDYKKVGAGSLKLFKENKDFVSVMIHGNNHLRHEMLVNVSKDKKTELLEQALWRMSRFTDRTGLEWARTMIFPHDKCSKDTVALMHHTGYHAVFIQTPYPNDMRHKKGTPHPLFDMFPSENSVEGFPIITRQSMESHYKDHNWHLKILFHAWLGKPIIPWTHHYFFKYGCGEMEERVDYINRHIAPEWKDVSGVLNNNYTVAKRNGCIYINMYSNILKINVPDNVPEVVLIKHGRDLLINKEALRVNGSGCEWDYKDHNCLSAVIKTNKQRMLHVDIVPVNARLEGRKHGLNFKAYLRRYLSELRDQAAPYFECND